MRTTRRTVLALTLGVVTLSALNPAVSRADEAVTVVGNAAGARADVDGG